VPALITWWTQDVRTLSPRGGAGEVAATGADLLDRWTEPHRRYHSTRHLVEMFWALEDLTDAGELGDDDAALGRVAAWFHDAVYDPAAVPGANETASAALAELMLPRVGCSAAATGAVVDLVRMTADHAVRHDSALHRAFHDADLWILAAPEARFDEYCGQVREEYAAVPEPMFRAARAQILRDLVGASGIYLTDHGRTHWDFLARDNVDRELARLS
jgi:predicted metal-dependent HD superfamily phosphohydrolase